MCEQVIPSFEEWVEYCFTQGYSDFNSSSKAEDSVAADERFERAERFVSLDPPLLASYVAKLFRTPSFVASRDTDDQIGDGTWFLFGVASSYFCELRSRQVPKRLQIECMSSVTTMYTDLFDRVCCKRGTDLDGD